MTSSQNQNDVISFRGTAVFPENAFIFGKCLSENALFSENGILLCSCNFPYVFSLFVFSLHLQSYFFFIILDLFSFPCEDLG
jgi:hypothetical protein